MRSTEIVTLSSDFQIAIPPKTCEVFGVRAGEKLEIIAYNGRIELIPIKRQMNSFRGIAKGINTDCARDDDRV